MPDDNLFDRPIRGVALWTGLRAGRGGSAQAMYRDTLTAFAPAAWLDVPDECGDLLVCAWEAPANTASQFISGIDR